MKNPTKTEIWSRQAIVLSYLPLEADVTEVKSSELLHSMTRAVLQNELDQRLADAKFIRDPRIKFIRDADQNVWARVYSKASTQKAENPDFCTGTYRKISPSKPGPDTLPAMDAAVL